jgi:type IV secretory pathway TraG/TraD family ATPase VirD4
MGWENRQEQKKRWARNKRSRRAVQRTKDPEDALVGKGVHARRKEVAKYILLAVAATAIGKTLW